MKRFLLIIACWYLTCPALAEEDWVSKWGTLLPAISYTSDYRFNGMSLSDRGAAVQGSLYLWRPDGYYAGIWLSEVDFQDGQTTFEIDTYVGRNTRYGKYETSIQLMYSAFNDDDVSGPTYDFFQLKAGVKRRFEALALGVAILWSPSGSAGAGDVTQLRAESEYRFSPYIKAVGTLGRGWFEKRVDRAYWDVGLTFEWKKLDVDVRYSGTDLGKQACFFTDWCEPGLYTKVTLASF